MNKGWLFWRKVQSHLTWAHCNWLRCCDVPATFFKIPVSEACVLLKLRNQVLTIFNFCFSFVFLREFFSRLWVFFVFPGVLPFHRCSPASEQNGVHVLINKVRWVTDFYLTFMQSHSWTKDSFLRQCNHRLRRNQRLFLISNFIDLNLSQAGPC